MPDGSKFVAIVQAQLDTSKIKSQLLNDSKKWSTSVKVKKFTLDTRGLSSQIQQALNGHSFTLKLTNVDVGNLSSTITGRVRGIGTQAGTAFSQSFYNRISQSGELGKAISSVESKFKTLTTRMNSLSDKDALSDEAHNKYIQLQHDLEQLTLLRNEFFSTTSTPAQKMAAYENFNTTLRRVQNNLSMVTNETRQFASATEVATLQNRMEAWLTNNSRATKTFGGQIQSLVQRLRELSAQGNVEEAELKQLAAEFNQVKAAAQAAGLTGKSFGTAIAGAFKSITRYVGVSTLIYSAFNAVKNGVRDVVDLDTALVDLKKTTDATDAELKEFYYTSNDIAKQLGVTTEQVISSAAEWSRLGFSIKDAETMAKTSSIFASISPGLDIDEATSGLVSTMKAFDIEADEALDGIASKINSIGNSQALSNSMIVEFLTRSSAAMKEANNTLEETIALGTAATEVTQDAASVGNALKTISMRVRGYDEETEEFIGNVEVLDGKIANLTKTAERPGGISLFTDETKTTFKSTTQLLRDISEIYDDLTDKQQAGLLEALAGGFSLPEYAVMYIKNIFNCRYCLRALYHNNRETRL